jgi:hypothetical protein
MQVDDPICHSPLGYVVATFALTEDQPVARLWSETRLSCDAGDHRQRGSLGDSGEGLTRVQDGIHACLEPR